MLSFEVSNILHVGFLVSMFKLLLVVFHMPIDKVSLQVSTCPIPNTAALYEKYSWYVESFSVDTLTESSISMRSRASYSFLKSSAPTVSGKR